MKLKFNKNLVFRWAVRLVIFAFLSFGIFQGIDRKAISYTAIFIAPFLIGAISCGWVCPAGLVQDVVFIKRFGFEISPKWHKILRVLRYIFLGLWLTGVFTIPTIIQHNIGGLSKGQLAFTLVGWLGISCVVVSIFINRFFCRYLCPYGAFAGIKSILRPITINRDIKLCINCKNCDKVCPMKICMSESDSSFSPNCINCFKCIENCPKKALYFGARNYRNNLKYIVGLFKKN